MVQKTERPERFHIRPRVTPEMVDSDALSRQYRGRTCPLALAINERLDAHPVLNGLVASVSSSTTVVLVSPSEKGVGLAQSMHVDRDVPVIGLATLRFRDGSSLVVNMSTGCVHG